MKQFYKELPLVLLGNMLLALSVGIFILPFDILSGGVAGVSVALMPLLNIDPKIIINSLMIITFLLGALFLGRNFAVKTIVSSLCYPLFLSIIPLLKMPVLNIEPFLASFYGGLLGGLGIGLVFRANGSTGGMDIPPLIIHKYTDIPVSRLVLIIDSITILIGLSTHGLEAVLIGFISVWTSSFVINKVLLFGGEAAKSVYIISDYLENINQEIHDRLDRGTTILSGQGGFTGDKRNVLLVVIMNNQYPELVSLVTEIDKNAFLIVQEAIEVKGEGFSLEHKI